MSGSIDQRAEPVQRSRTAARLSLVEPDGIAPVRRAIRVLYVEDDVDDVFLVERQMRALPGFSVDFHHAATLGVAQDRVRADRFDVVLCDFWLGCETTIPLIDELRDREQPCPTVLVSSLENDDIELIGRRAGAAGFVAKADLSPSALDRIFTTLLPAEERAERQDAGLGRWIQVLLASLNDSGAGLGAADEESRAIIEEFVTASGVSRLALAEALAGAERAQRLGHSDLLRFDAVSYVVDAVSQVSLQAARDGLVDFLPPAVPVMVEANPALFGDVMQGFFAGAMDAVADGVAVIVRLRLDAGRIVISLARQDGGGPPPVASSMTGYGDGEARLRAAVETRRLLVEALARALGGSILRDEAAGALLLTLPLRTSG